MPSPAAPLLCSQTAQAEQLELERKAQMQTSATRSGRKLPPKPDTPEPTEGRKHIDVQTEQYLEELTDRPVEVDVDTQTDAFMDQLPAPIFIPMKTGVDVETQIYEGDLFDFDMEVRASALGRSAPWRLGRAPCFACRDPRHSPRSLDPRLRSCGRWSQFWKCSWARPWSSR